MTKRKIVPKFKKSMRPLKYKKKTLTSKEDINIRGEDKSNLLINLANIGFTRLPKHGSVRVIGNNSVFEPGYI